MGVGRSGSDAVRADKVDTMRLPRPFEGNYGVTLAVAIFAIAPFVFITTSGTMYEKQLTADLATNRTALSILAGLAVAGYAFGALLGGDLIQRFPQRALFIACEWLFIAGCAVGGSAGTVVQFGAGKVLLAFATGLLLVIALPPVVQRFPARKMSVTAAAVNIGFFGAVTAGPLIGGAIAATHTWRWFYAALGLVGFIVFAVSLFTLPDRDPPNPGLPFDVSAVGLALVATTLPFWASGELIAHGFSSFLFMVPTAVGVAAFVALLLLEYHKKEPLSPVKPLWKAVPVAGVIIAMFGGAALVTFMQLLEQFELNVAHAQPLWAGVLFWPEVLGTIVAAVLLGTLIRSRFLALLPLAGMILIIAAGAMQLFVSTMTPPAFVLTVTGLLGVGAGATVAPGLWLAGFSLPSSMVGRTFALVELVRSEADFIISPILVQVALVASGGMLLNQSGVKMAVWITIGVAVAATVAAVGVYASGGTRLLQPDLEKWLESGDKNAVAIESPALGAARR